MRAITYVFSTFIFALLLCCQLSPANAGTSASWAEGDGWLIDGNSTGFCQLAVFYQRGGVVSVLAAGALREPSMGFLDRNIKPLVEDLDIVEATISFSSGEAFPLVARVIDDMTIMADVPIQAIIAFGETRRFELRVRGVFIGAYNLAGTRSMLLELGKCVQAMQGEIS